MTSSPRPGADAGSPRAHTTAMRTLAVLLVAAAACSDPGGGTVDARPPDAAEPDAPLDAAPDAPYGLVEASAPEAPGARCRYGGTRVSAGLDDGAPGGTAGNGVLEPEETDGVRFACDGPPPAGEVAATGLDAAPVTAACRPPETGGVAYLMEPVFGDVVFPADPDCRAGVNDERCDDAFRPVALRQHPITRRFYVAQQNGRVLRFDEGGTAATVALDLRAKTIFGYEPGVLNLDLDPQDPQRAYLSYVTCVSQEAGAIVDGSVTCADGEQTNVYTAIARFDLDEAGDLVAGSERLVLEIAHPRTEHNGGGARFGGDGMLWIGVGDGGDFPTTAPQDPDSLLGKLLRIDVHDPDGARYVVPADNPFVGMAGHRPEVWAMGLRNPWRFDVVTGGGPTRVWVGDVGLVTAEEVDLVHAGDNLGWPRMEGPYCRPTGDDAHRVTVLADATCDPAGALTRPVYHYEQGRGVSITGGVQYRGAAIPALAGRYLFADFSTGQVMSLRADGPAWRRDFLVDSNLLIAGIDTDLAGEVYAFDWWTGRITKLVATPVARARPPASLRATGCVDAIDPLRPAAGAIPFAPSAVLVDGEGIYKDRWMYLPPGGRLTEYAETGTLIFPPGTVLVKNFDVGLRRVETRILYFHADFTWTMWSYRWNEAQTDATLGGDLVKATIDGHAYVFPADGDCERCHNRSTGRVLGPRVEQLNGVLYYETTGRFANQLDTLRAVGLVQRVIAPDPTRPIGDGNAEIVPLPAAGALPRQAEYADESASLRERAGGYLEMNCSNCHRPAGGGRGDFSLRKASFLGACDLPVQAGTYDQPAMRVIAPGAPDLSMIWRRVVEASLPYRMHPYRASADLEGGALLRRWLLEESAADCSMAAARVAHGGAAAAPEAHAPHADELATMARWLDATRPARQARRR